MRRLCGVVYGCLMLCLAGPAWPQAGASDEGPLESGRAAINHHNYAQAIRVLKAGIKEHRDNQNLKLELGRAYLYNHQDKQAIRLFHEVLAHDPANRPAKLQLARALGYEADYKASDALYRELLASDPGDEAAAVGLTRNLMHESRLEEARNVCDAGLAQHPDSVKLREYKLQVNGRAANKSVSSGGGEPNPAAQKRRGQLQGSSGYFSDSAGNRSLRSSQFFDHQIARNLTTRFYVEERSLWLSGGPKANVLWGTDELRLQLTRELAASATGGVARFADGGTRTLYRGSVELHPAKHLWVSGGFWRRPIVPTYDASQFKLLAEGWHSQLEWYPRGWWVTGSWSREHYSDSNRDKRLEGQFLRWFGSSRFSVGAGYHFNYLAFDQTFLHGYFNPSSYYNHLGRGGIRFRVGKAFRAEYLGGVGVESIAGAPYQNAWELALKNHYKLENWEFSGDYFYYHLPQSSGAFTSQAGRVTAAYRF